MSTNTQPYKGARDFYPEDKQFQKWIFEKWRRVVERYGYEEYDAPILEPTELFLIKGSEEIIKDQTYTFKDRGDRSVTIRTEMTPSVSRLVAGRRQELAYPVRWYSIPNLWRYERMQKGRLREFWQLNVDMFGIDNEMAELEMIQIIDDLFQSFKAKRSSYTIKINSRLLINEVLLDSGFNSEKSTEIIRLIDKINKLSVEDFATKLDNLTGSKDNSKQIISLLATINPSDLPDRFKKIRSVEVLLNLLKDTKALGITNIEFDMTLMRGFDYYTDLVFEVFDNSEENNRSILGGGRYDGLVGQFGVEPIPTIGFAVGDVVFADFLRTHKLVPNIKKTCEIAVILQNQNCTSAARKAADELREIGVNTSVDYSVRKLEKQLKSAIKSGVRYALIVGDEEVKSGLFTLKDLKTSKEEKHSIGRIVSIVKDARK